MSKGWSCIGHSLIPSSFLLTYPGVLFRNREMRVCSSPVLHRLSQWTDMLKSLCSSPWSVQLHSPGHWGPPVNVFACCLFSSLRARPPPSHVVVTKPCPTLARLLCPFPLDFPGKKAGVGCHFLLQEILSTQGSNPRQLHWQVDSLPRNLQGSLGAGR